MIQRPTVNQTVNLPRRDSRGNVIAHKVHQLSVDLARVSHCVSLGFRKDQPFRVL